MGPGQPPLSAFSKRCSTGELETLVTAPCLRQAVPPAAGTPLSKKDIPQPAATSSVLPFPVVHSKHLTENLWQSPHTEHRRQSIPNRQTKPSYKGICSTQSGSGGRGPLPSVASIFCLLTAGHCPAMGSAELGPLADPWPRLGPRAVPNAWGCSCSWPPRLPHSWLRRWDGPGCQGLAPMDAHGEPLALSCPNTFRKAPWSSH